MKLGGLSGNLKNIIPNRYYLYEDFEGYVESRPISGNIIIDNDVDKLLIGNKVRPKWEYPDGNITFINGYCKLNKGIGANRRFYTKTTKNIGSWEFKVMVSEALVQNYILMAFIYQGGNDYLGIFIQASRNIILVKRIGGGEVTLVNANFIIDIGTYYRIKITRNEGGNFELFIDDVSKGTAQTSDEPTTNYIHFENPSNSDLYIQSLKVI